MKWTEAIDRWVQGVIAFEELRFVTDASLPLGGQLRAVSHALVTYPNGYGASIIVGGLAYGDAKGPYELAVICWDEQAYALLDDSRSDLGEAFDKTLGVYPYLDEAAVEDLLARIRALSPRWA